MNVASQALYTALVAAGGPEDRDLVADAAAIALPNGETLAIVSMASVSGPDSWAILDTGAVDQLAFVEGQAAFNDFITAVVSASI